MQLSDQVTVRTCFASDESFLREILYHAIFVPPGLPPPAKNIVEQPDIARYVQNFGQRPGDQGMLAELGSVPCGAVWVRLIQGYGFVDSQTPELTIAVLPENRDRGIGILLLRALFEQIQPQYKQISLSVSELNPAIHLYERLGFVVVRREGSSITMLKRLVPFEHD